MPKTRYLTPKPGASELSKLFYGELKAQNMKCYELENHVGVSQSTLRKILLAPESAGMDKVMKIAKTLGIKKAQVCQAWQW